MRVIPESRAHGCSPSKVQPVRPEHEPTLLLHSMMRCKSCTCTVRQRSLALDAGVEAAALLEVAPAWAPVACLRSRSNCCWK